MSLSAEVRLAPTGEEPSFGGSLRIRQILDDQGRPAYDELRFAGDSGAIFRVGTTQVVGMIIQHNLQCEGDPVLEKALQSCSTPKAPKKTPKPKR